MFRRSRLSIRPNVGTTGRAAATPQEAPPSNQESSEPPKDSSKSNTDTAGTDNQSAVVQSEQTPPTGDNNDQNVESTTSSAALQRRKRFSIKPKVAPGRPVTHPRTPKSPIKPVLQSHIEVPSSDLDKPTSSQVGTTAPPQALLSPRHRRASEESRQAKTQPKPTLTSSGGSETLSAPPAEDSVEQIHLRPDGGKKESSSAGQVKEVSLRQPDKVPPSLPEKEAIEISEKAKTLVSSKSAVSTSPSKFSLSRLLNDPSDLQRLEKARKLRELLRQEIHKEKKLKRAKARVKEYTLDPAKMTMRDLIHYLPMSNPMTSTLQESVQENETVVPQSPVREQSPERAQEPQVQPKIMSPRQQGEEEEEEEGGGEEAAAGADDEEEEEEEALMVPQVKVAEDGSLIIDEESLTVEVQRTKGPNPVQDRDPIFERGSTTTYASFRKGNYSKPWSSEETDMFFLAISMVGTDFTMICQLFPHRARSEIKNKFKKEERCNAWRIDKAFRERRKLDIEYFTKLLEKILEVQKNKKKLKSLAAKNKTPRKRVRKPKGKKAARNLSDVEEEDEVDEEEEGEKENEELCNEGGSPVSKPARKRRRNDNGDASPEQPDGKINKRGKKKKKPVEASVPTDTEAALPDDHTTSDQCDAPKDTTDVKPAKLSRGRVPKLPLPAGLKRSKKPPPSSTKSKENTLDKEGENMSGEASTEQASKDASPSRQTNEGESADENMESDEESCVKPPRPTRYGRVPKLTQHLNYPAKEETHPPASETTPASPAGHTASAAKAKPKGTAKRGRSARQQAAKESKKPKLITLRASQSEDSDDEDDESRAAAAIMGSAASCSGIHGSAAVFVPASLCSPQPFVTEVEETMEELDILANMPDVLGISQDALCPEASCEQAQNEAGTAEPCEHQLDLLVDVIDFLSSEHTEVSEDESYNEAAQTLLTIGNVAHLSHPSQNQASMEDLPNTSVIANESSQSVSDVQQEINTGPMSVASAHEITEPSETVGDMEPESNTTEEWPPSQTADTLITNPSEEIYCEQKIETVSDPQLQSNPESSKETSSQTKKGRFSKIKPKPNIARASRTTQSNSQTNNSKLSLRTAEDGHSSASDIFQVSHSQQVPETLSELQNSSPTVTGEISCSDIRLKEEMSGHQEAAGRSVIADQSTSENQNSCIPETPLKSSRENLTTEHTDEKLTPLDRTGDISYSSSLTSITVTGSASVCEGTDLVCVSPVNQEEETEVTNTSETRRGQFHKVKSTDNLLQAPETERPKTQTTQDPVTHLELVDKPSIQTANLQPTEKPAEKIETEPTGSAGLPETPSQNTGPDSGFVPSVNMDSTHETSITEEKKTDVEFTSQADSCSESSEQNAPQRRRRFPKVKPKPNLGSSPRSTQSRAQLKCLSKSSNQLCKDSSSNATSEQQPVKENSAKTQVESAERDSQHLTPSHSSLNIELSSANAGNAESEKSLGGTNEDAQSDNIVMATSWVAESKTMFADSVSENKTNTRPPVEESTGGCISNQDKVETLDTGAASLCNTEQEINSRVNPNPAESNTHPVGHPSTVSGVQHSHDVSVPTTKAESVPENTQQPQSETHCDIQGQEAGPHPSETSETNQANKDKCPSHESLSETQDGTADSSKTSRKPPQTQRGRFIKPKPNLGRSGRPQRPQSKTQNTTDSGICSDTADASDSQKAVSELSSDVQETLEGAKEQGGGLDVPPSDAGSSSGDLTQVHDSSAQSFQDATTSSTMETLNYQSLSIFQDILTEQVPSDPDEPFFVLSLTAIPVCPSGEVLDTVSEPYLPVTDALAQQESSGPGETVTAGSDGSFANIHVPTSTEASNETDLISGKDIGPDPAVSEKLLVERPENPQEGTSAQPPNLPDTTENTQESDDPPTKRRQTGRRAKLQVKPKTARNRPTRNKESLAAKEANEPLQTNTTLDPEIPRPSMQPDATDSTAKTWIEIISESEEESEDHLVTEKSGEAVEDRSSGAQRQTTESRGKRRTRKSQNVLPVIPETNSTKQPSDPPQAKARCSQVKTPRAARRSAAPPAGASTSHDVAYSTVPEETHSPVSATSPSQMQMDVQQSGDHSQPHFDTTPSTSQCTEVLSTQQSDWMESSQVDDEPTSVSQYFLSDIFTDVEDK